MTQSENTTGKTIGLIGGMSWESTVVYYQLLNRLTREQRGGLHSAQLLLWSFDFATIEALRRLYRHLHQYHAQDGPCGC